MPSNLPQPQATLTLREINRATLARQMLLDRQRLGSVEAIERLAGLQAQYSPSPYIGLWSRLVDFQRDELTEAILSRQVVKGSFMRWTLHLVSARDYPYVNQVVSDARVASLRKQVERAGADSVALHESLLDFLSEPRQIDEMVAYLGPQLPGGAPETEQEGRMLWNWATAHGGIVHAPPSGTWRSFGKNSYVSARTWLGEIEEPSLAESVAYVLRRYLAAFGPATRADAMEWGGFRTVTHLDAALEALADELVAFKDERGKTLYDLRDAPRPGGDVDAPVRFLPMWDNLLLGHQNRQRVMSDEHRKLIFTPNLGVLTTFLVDGMTAGLWVSERKRGTARLEIRPFALLDASSRAALEVEAEGLLRFIEPDASTFEVVTTS